MTDIIYTGQFFFHFLENFNFNYKMIEPINSDLPAKINAAFSPTTDVPLVSQPLRSYCAALVETIAKQSETITKQSERIKDLKTIRKNLKAEIKDLKIEIENLRNLEVKNKQNKQKTINITI